MRLGRGRHVLLRNGLLQLQLPSDRVQRDCLGLQELLLFQPLNRLDPSPFFPFRNVSSSLPTPLLNFFHSTTPFLPTLFRLPYQWTKFLLPFPSCSCLSRLRGVSHLTPALGAREIIISASNSSQLLNCLCNPGFWSCYCWSRRCCSPRLLITQTPPNLLLLFCDLLRHRNHHPPFCTMETQRP